MNIQPLIVTDIETTNVLPSSGVISIGTSVIFIDYEDYKPLLVNELEERDMGLYMDARRLTAYNNVDSSLITGQNYSLNIISRQYVLPINIQLKELHRTKNDRTMDFHKSLKFSDMYLSEDLDKKIVEQARKDNMLVTDLAFNSLKTILEDFLEFVSDISILGSDYLKHFAWHDSFDYGIINNLLEEVGLETFDNRNVYDIASIMFPLNEKSFHVFKGNHTAGVDSVVEAVYLYNALNLKHIQMKEKYESV